jgi:hypothetical protein
MKRVIIFQLLTALIGSFIMWLCGANQGIGSYITGALVVAGNFIFLGSSMNLVFRKKLIALPVLIIVFKYAILGIILYHLVKQSWMQPFWFAIGVASMMGGSLIYGLTLGFFKEE